MTEHYRYLYSYVLSRVGDFHDAEDIVQETYLTALMKRDAFRGDSHIRTWLCGIAENKIRQHIRRRAVSLTRHAEMVEEIPETDPDRLIAAEELELLHQSVADLPPELRECAVVSILCGMDGRDAAEILGVPVQTVYNRVHRIKKLLRGQLEDHMETSLELFSSLINEGMTAVERTAAHFRQFYDLCDARDSEGAARLLLISPVFAADSAMAHFMIMQQCDMAVRVLRLGKDEPVTRQLALLGAQEFRLAEKLGFRGIIDNDTGEELPEHFFYEGAAQFFGAVGDFDRARGMCEQSKALGNPSDMKYAIILEDAGRLTEALGVLENEANRETITPYERCFAYNHIANCHKKLGNTELELKYFLLVYDTVKAGGVIEDEEAFAHFHAGDAYAVAMTYAKMGKKTEMMPYLEEAVGINPQYADWARAQAVFAPYRDDADFVKLCGTGEGKLFSIRG